MAGRLESRPNGRRMVRVVVEDGDPADLSLQFEASRGAAERFETAGDLGRTEAEQKGGPGHDEGVLGVVTACDLKPDLNGFV